MAFDFKKEYRELYLPGRKPEIVTVPPMQYIAVRGQGNPNEEGGAYQQVIGVLYSLAFTLKMSQRAGHEIAGFFDYVVPPLEGFWQMGEAGAGAADKSEYRWISVIRLPDFVKRADFDWAVQAVEKKKGLVCSGAELLTIDEGLCVQIMHLGPFDAEAESIALMDDYLARNGCAPDLNETRLHHEIYMSDARRVAPEKWKTVIRHPIRRMEQAAR